MLLYPLLITIACFTDRISDDMQGSIQVKARNGFRVQLKVPHLILG